MINYWNLIRKVYNTEYIYNSSKTKVSIIERVFDDLSIKPKTVAFINYNPIIELLADNYDVSIIESQKSLVNHEKVSIIGNNKKYFDVVLGLDEHLTYYANEFEQRNELSKIADICNGWFITTLADYKNSAPFKKNQVELLEFKNNNLVIENHIADQLDKQAWQSYYYQIENHKDLTVVGPYQRRTLYFKQLAKYASDLGSREYVIQKNALYKGFAKRQWEHIITVRF